MAKKTYAEIQAEIARLQKEAEAVRQAEVEGVIARIREAIEVYGLSPQDLGFGGAAVRATGPGRAGRGRRAAAGAAAQDAKFRDAEGHVWSGRGPRPKWLREALAAGHNLEEFAVR